MPIKNGSSPATLHDVAKLAGVSYQTVSRVVNKMPKVAPDTLEKVNQAIAELNYRPNRAARSLVTGKSNAIHVLAFDLFNLRTIPFMEMAASEKGYQLRITALHQDLSLPEIRQKLAEIASSQVDGIVLSMPWSTVPYQELLDLSGGIPMVIVGCNLGPETNSVLIDQRAGTRQAVQHLLDLGHRQFAEIAGAIAKYEDSRIRHETYQELLRANSLEPGPSETGNFTMQSGFEAMNRLLAQNCPFTALVCANDEMALGAIRAAHEAGLKVPRDLSVVGFDNLDFAAFCTPTLTTVQQDYQALGTQSAQHLLSLIQDPGAAAHHRIIYPKLIVRQSTAHPPSTKRKA